jgi:hypothetical protein
MSGALPNFLAAAAHGEHNSQCFQVFGFDVMLDGTGRPWLLEVNLDPALGTESPIDHKIKSHMLVPPRLRKGRLRCRCPPLGKSPKLRPARCRTLMRRLFQR